MELRDGLRRARIGVEGSFWMMRLNWSWAPLVVAPGALVAATPPPAGGMVAIMAMAALSRAGVNVINDILDLEKDHRTAPELPLPSGVVTLPQALALVVLIAVAIMATAALASVSLLSYVGCLAALSAGAILTAAYSFVKPYAVLAATVAASVYVCLPLSAWLAVGLGPAVGMLLVAAYQLFYGVAGNLQASLRDVESDAEVGNISLAVKLGPRRALLLGAAMEVLAHAMIVAVALWTGRPQVGLPLAAVSLCLVLSAYRSAVRRCGTVNGRIERMVAARRLGLSRQAEPLALVATFSIPVALGALAFTAIALLVLIPGYSRRIVGRGLAREAEACLG